MTYDLLRNTKETAAKQAAFDEERNKLTKESKDLRQQVVRLENEETKKSELLYQRELEMAALEAKLRLENDELERSVAALVSSSQSQSSAYATQLEDLQLTLTTTAAELQVTCCERLNDVVDTPIYIPCQLHIHSYICLSYIYRLLYVPSLIYALSLVHTLSYAQVTRDDLDAMTSTTAPTLRAHLQSCREDLHAAQLELRNTLDRWYVTAVVLACRDTSWCPYTGVHHPLHVIIGART